MADMAASTTVVDEVFEVIQDMANNKMVQAVDEINATLAEKSDRKLQKLQRRQELLQELEDCDNDIKECDEGVSSLEKKRNLLVALINVFEAHSKELVDDDDNHEEEVPESVQGSPKRDFAGQHRSLLADEERGEEEQEHGNDMRAEDVARHSKRNQRILSLQQQLTLSSSATRKRTRTDRANDDNSDTESVDDLEMQPPKKRTNHHHPSAHHGASLMDSSSNNHNNNKQPAHPHPEPASLTVTSASLRSHAAAATRLLNFNLNNNNTSGTPSKKSPTPEHHESHEQGTLPATASPTPGRIYLTQYNKRPHACLALPYNPPTPAAFAAIGINDTFENTCLKKRGIPACYETQEVHERGKKTRKQRFIVGWKGDDYEDGGVLAGDRKFPVLIFERGMRVPLYRGEEGGEGWVFSGEEICIWVNADKLTRFDVDDPAYDALAGIEAARDYLERVASMCVDEDEGDDEGWEEEEEVGGDGGPAEDAEEEHTVAANDVSPCLIQSMKLTLEASSD